MTFPEFLLSLVFFSYCACYAFSLRKGKTVFDTASGNEIYIGKNGHYSVGMTETDKSPSTSPT